MNHLPYIEVSFVVDGKNFELEKLTEELGILPTEVRGLNDWPDAVKNNPNLPLELQARCEWSISQEEYLCKQIEIPIRKIIAQIKGKEQKLNDFCKKNNLSKALCITIHAKTMCLPEMYLPPCIVSYWGNLDVAIGFDVYTY